MYSVLGTIAVWNRNGGSWECTVTLEGHENEVKCAVFSPSGNFLATCSRDKSGKTSLLANSDLLIKSIKINEKLTEIFHNKNIKNSYSWFSFFFKEKNSSWIFAHYNKLKKEIFFLVWLWDVDKEDDDYMCASVLHSHTQVLFIPSGKFLYCYTRQ